jgi:UDP-N-acetylmuramate dehydrogenase
MTIASPPNVLKSLAPEGVERNARLESRHSMGLDCQAWALAEANSPAHLAEVIAWAESNNKRWRVLGSGTNVLFTSDRVDALIVKLGKRGVARCGAATTWVPLIRAAREAGFGGLEYGWRIPGTIGGALAGNAGAAGRAICEDLVRVRVMNQRGELRELEQKDINYGYRRSSLGECMVLEAELRLKPALVEEIDERLEQMNVMREAQPRGTRSSGCFFRNPDQGPAGKLIDQCGLKGASEGGAAVSDIHANFFINRGGARPDDMLRLMRRVRSGVMDKTGVWLNPEVRMI